MTDFVPIDHQYNCVSLLHRSGLGILKITYDPHIDILWLENDVVSSFAQGGPSGELKNFHVPRQVFTVYNNDYAITKALLAKIVDICASIE